VTLLGIDGLSQVCIGHDRLQTQVIRLTKQNGNVINGENRSLVLLFSGDRYKSAYRQISSCRLGAIAMDVGEQLPATKSFGGAANKPRRD